MLIIRGIRIRQEREWFRLHDVFKASGRPDYNTPARWLKSRSFHFLNKPKKVKVDTDFDIIWVRLELIPAYAKWISIHFQREVREAINGYKLAKAAGLIERESSAETQAYQDSGHGPGSTIRTGEDHTYRQKAILAQEDFSKIQPRYCDKVCGMPCSLKKPMMADINDDKADIIIIQDHRAGADGWKTAQQVNQLHNQQIHALARLAFGRDLTFKVLNLTKCWGESNKKVTATQMLGCAPYLWEEIRRTKPKAIVSMATEVTKALGFPYSNYNNRGEYYLTNTDALPEVPVLITLHVRVLNMLRQNASGKMYGADFTGVILNDLAKIPQILNRQIPIGGLRENVERIIADQVFVTSKLEHVKDIADVLMKLPPNQVISWDLETTGLDPWAPDARI